MSSENMDDHDHDDDSTSGDGEGVWSADIEQCFREALLLFPPCGRRKHILQEEGGGKMYGRNELIARYIMMRTGKSRTRKQVSSHIQVLARRRQKAEAASSALNSPANSITTTDQSPPAIRQASAIIHAATNGASNGPLMGGHPARQMSNGFHQTGGVPFGSAPIASADIWNDRPIVTQKMRLVEFSAFIERRACTPQANGFSASSSLSTTPIDGLLMSSPNGDLLEPVIDLAGRQASQPPVYPLSSNANLPAQFNQATPFPSVAASNHPAATHHQATTILGHNSSPLPNNVPSSNQQSTVQQHNTNNQMNGSMQTISGSQNAGFSRHSYVRIDYSASGQGCVGRTHPASATAKLERIDIGQIQDKFPEIGGQEGLFQRGPADAFFLVKFWADLNNDFEFNLDDQNSFFGFSSRFETLEPLKDITCSTKACSYGLQVVEKVEKVFSAFNAANGRYSYDINRSPMCEFMIQFIKKLRRLPRASQMNSVLENFTVLQVVTNESTSEILLCLAYVFEVASPTNGPLTGPQYNVYKLTKD